MWTSLVLCVLWAVCNCELASELSVLKHILLYHFQLDFQSHLMIELDSEAAKSTKIVNNCECIVLTWLAPRPIEFTTKNIERFLVKLAINYCTDASGDL